MNRETYFVGRTAEGDRVYVELALEPYQHPETSETIWHEPLTDHDRPTFSASGFVIPKGRREADRSGQCLDVLHEVTAPADGWTYADALAVFAVWDRWHLNAMRAACAHMDPDRLIREPDQYNPAGRISTSANKCPVSDYRYGHAWLTEPLPDHVIAEIHRLRALPHGDVPENY